MGRNLSFNPHDQAVNRQKTTINEANASVLSGEFHGPVYIQPSFACFPIPRQIPPQPSDFTGREDDLQELLGLLERDSVIIGLRGLGGVGKTALAFALAENTKDRYPDGQLFVSMMGTSQQPLTPSEAMAQIIRSYNLDLRLPKSEAELANLYRSVLNGKRALLLLDNALDEHQVRPLLPPARCSLIVTSRWKFKLPGMTLKDLKVLKLDEAVELLQNTAGRDYLGDRSQNKGDWMDMALLCGCLPVALRAAGSFLANTTDSSPGGYVKELRDEWKRLGIIGKEGVEEGALAKFSLSYGRLAAETARVFRLLSIFPADFNAQAEEEICKDDGHRHLSDLVRWSLVDFHRSGSGDEGRYRLHDLVRLFAAGRRVEVESTGAQNDVQHRHAKHYKEVLSSATELYENGDVLAGLRKFDLERMNIEAGWAWAKKNFAGNDAAASLCCGYLNWPYLLDLRMHPKERILWLETALSASRQLKDKSRECGHLHNIGIAYDNLGEYHKAIEYQKKSLAIARQIGDKKSEGRALGNLGLAYDNLGKYREAIRYQEKSLAIAREIGDRKSEGKALGDLGLAYDSLGDYHNAIEFQEKSLAIAREIGDKKSEGYALGNLGIAYDRQGDYRKAIEYHEQRLVIAGEIRDRGSEGYAIGSLGLAYYNLGEYTKAIEHQEKHLAIAREIGDRKGEGYALGNLGSVYIRLCDYKKAIEYHEQRLVIAREIGHRKGEGHALGNLGLAYAALGDTLKAVEYYEQALAIAREIGDRRGEGNALWNIGLAREELDDRARAIKYAKAALKIYEEIGDPSAEEVKRTLQEWSHQ